MYAFLEFSVTADVTIVVSVGSPDQAHLLRLPHTSVLTFLEREFSPFARLVKGLVS